MLNELLEEYKETNDKKYIKEFTDLLWNSKYKLKKHKKYYKYIVNEEHLHNRQELIELFDKYKYIEFTFCKSYYKKRLDYIDYIRIHVNNMYGLLVDKEIYLPKEYYQLLLTPKREYYNSVNKLKNSEEVDFEEVRNKIEFAILQAEEIKNTAIENKINIKWNDYKRLINTYIERIFNNYIPQHEYEKEHGWEMKISVDGWSEDNYIIRYFCKSLTGYMRNYVKDSKRVKEKYCQSCGTEILTSSNRQKYCKKCLHEKQKGWQRESMKKARLKM